MLLLALASPASSQPGPVSGADPELREEIEALVLNVWDQRMARRFEPVLDLPETEVRARFEVFSRWLAEIRKGTFPGHPPLPPELVERHRELAERFGVGIPEAELDSVLRFLEENLEHLEKASGIQVPPPM